jgi:ATP-dependent Clp protease ATP-binding subunit ClpC
VFERFTEPARHVVVIAGEEARALQQNYIGTEHILLGLLREEEGLAARVLGSLGLTLEKARAQVVRTVAPSEEVTSGQIPFTPRAKKVLELALREALGLGHDYIGTEHILLGLVRDNEGVAMRVLLDFDAGPEKVRNEVIRQLPGSEGHECSRGTAAARMSELTFTASPDDQLLRLLMAAAGRALTDQRAEFGLADLLSVAKENHDDR